MGEADLSKIVGLIMENPSLVEEIRALADDSGTSKEAAKNPGATSEQPAQEPVRVEEPIDYSKIKRLSPDEYEEISK